jgi:hypothetical protein
MLLTILCLRHAPAFAEMPPPIAAGLTPPFHDILRLIADDDVHFHDADAHDYADTAAAAIPPAEEMIFRLFDAG